MKLFQSKKYMLVVLGLIWASGCSSPEIPTQKQPQIPGVLEEVNEGAKSGNLTDTPENPLVTNVSEKLKNLGYEALGLQFENDDTLLLLGNVFDSALTYDRKIKIIYTGLEMSYDSKHQSLTIGGTKNLGTILNFIDKNIPKKETFEQSDSTTVPADVTQSSMESEPQIEPSKNKSKPQKKKSRKSKAKAKSIGVKPTKKNMVQPKKPSPVTQPTVTTEPPGPSSEPIPTDSQPLMPEPESKPDEAPEVIQPSEL